QKGEGSEKINKNSPPPKTAIVRNREGCRPPPKIDRHCQRDDHPDEQQCDGRRQQSPSKNLGLLRRHRRLLLSLEGRCGCRPCSGRSAAKIGAARYLI